ncbi:hypothetical protein COCNU_14G003910 [Cocos nucifera]|uniref:Uncharacterized protein n=1 Tax=Cocos nucifera TaxID=13894 RepID=A0A8K0IV84_COCNU|nr:hypothetical protein COCNU_14G003910 [Cocos nucifera]
MGNKIGRRRLVVDEKYARPQGHYQHRDVDHRKPLKLILDSNLTPCYPGDEESSLDLEECLICFPEEHWVIEARIKMQQQEPQHEAERIQKREDASLSSRMVTAEELNIMIHWLACFQCHLLDVQDKVMDSFLLKAHLPGQRINTYHTRGKTDA